MAQGTVGTAHQLVIIGGSAGGLELILQLLPLLARPLAVPLVVVLHRRSTADDVLAELLTAKTRIHVKEAEEKDMPEAGTIYLAPPDYHLLFEQEGSFSLDASEKVNFSRPSIDVCFSSAARVFGKGLVCVLISGANADGAEGMADARNAGATTVAQLPATAEVPYMPQSAIDRGAATYILDAQGIADLINDIAKDS